MSVSAPRTSVHAAVWGPTRPDYLAAVIDLVEWLKAQDSQAPQDQRNPGPPPPEHAPTLRYELSGLNVHQTETRSIALYGTGIVASRVRRTWAWSLSAAQTGESYL